MHGWRAAHDDEPRPVRGERGGRGERGRGRVLGRGAAALLLVLAAAGCGALPASTQKGPDRAFLDQVAKDPFPSATQSGVTPGSR